MLYNVNEEEKLRLDVNSACSQIEHDVVEVLVPWVSAYCAVLV